MCGREQATDVAQDAALHTLHETFGLRILRFTRYLIRGHLAEFGHVAPNGTPHLEKLNAIVRDEAADMALPTTAREMLREMFDLVKGLDERIAQLDKEIGRWAVKMKAPDA